LDIIKQCTSAAKWIEFDYNGQWKPLTEEKLANRRGGNAKPTPQPAQPTNGNGQAHEFVCEDSDQSDDDTSHLKTTSSDLKQQRTMPVVVPQKEIELIELDDD